MIANYVTIEKFYQVTGYTPDAIRSKINRGDLVKDQEYTKAPDGRILIIVEGYHSWVETSIQESESQATRQLKLTSTTKQRAALPRASLTQALPR
ncbi:hypothetical protein SAMN05421882_100950 [Nitrosomonas communis]|uniref:Excisionase n=2 Tax=Nitrosomonas communis TaxID=44574 RepID=A0A1H2T1Z1_9PROT|nr:hypothetical protein SAMN05421882_100950 [Nitrosomonas communis]